MACDRALVLAFVLAACTAPADGTEPAASRGDASREDGTPGATPPRGTPGEPAVCPGRARLGLGKELFTTTVQPLRDRPDDASGALRNLPARERVVVETAACEGAEWAHVRDGRDGVGWIRIASLAETGGLPHLPYSAERGGKLAAKAVELHEAQASRDLCVKGIVDSLSASGILPAAGWIPFQENAISVGTYANEHPEELVARGFRREYGLGTTKLPQGALLVWRAGQCGRHPDWGHTEIVVDTASSRACSDHCSQIPRDCGDPWAWVPTTLPE